MELHMSAGFGPDSSISWTFFDLQVGVHGVDGGEILQLRMVCIVFIVLSGLEFTEM